VGNELSHGQIQQMRCYRLAAGRRRNHSQGLRRRHELTRPGHVARATRSRLAWWRGAASTVSPLGSATETRPRSADSAAGRFEVRHQAISTRAATALREKARTRLVHRLLGWGAPHGKRIGAACRDTRLGVAERLEAEFGVVVAHPGVAGAVEREDCHAHVNRDIVIDATPRRLLNATSGGLLLSPKRTRAPAVVGRL